MNNHFSLESNTLQNLFLIHAGDAQRRSIRRCQSTIASAAIVDVDKLRKFNEGILLRSHLCHLVPEFGVVDVDVCWAFNPVKHLLRITYSHISAILMTTDNS